MKLINSKDLHDLKLKIKGTEHNGMKLDAISLSRVERVLWSTEPQNRFVSSTCLVSFSKIMRTSFPLIKPTSVLGQKKSLRLINLKNKRRPGLQNINKNSMKKKEPKGKHRTLALRTRERK